METILLLLNLNQVLSGEISGNDFNRDNFGFIAAYETTSECNDALIKLISTEPENPDNWTVVFNNESAAATSDEFVILTCVPKLDDVQNALTLSQPDKSDETAKAGTNSDNEMEGLLNDLEAISAPNKLVYDTLHSMTTRITDAWKRPNNYQGGFEVFLLMSLSPDGSLDNVEVIRPSGNDQFDKSAIDAVKNASPFNEIQQFDASIFEEKFKTLTVKFRPED